MAGVAGSPGHRTLVILVLLGTAVAMANPPTFQCARNALAFNFSLALQPFRGPDFAQALRDALNATACGGFATPPALPSPINTSLTPFAPAQWHVVVDPTASIPGALPSVAAALADLRRWRSDGGRGPATVELAPGAHRVGALGLRLGPSDSDTAFVGRRGPDGAVAAWLTGAEALPDTVAWAPVNVSGGANIWAADIRGWLAAVAGDGVAGLRVGGARQTLARYPNADPERDGFGSALRAEAWLPPAALGPSTQFSPPTPVRNVTGNYSRFALGVGGACAVFDPPASLWCSTERTQSGGDDPFVLPSGLVASPAVLPHSPYADPSTAVFHAFRPSRWESYMFAVAGTTPGNASTYLFGAGGFQGARGCAAGEAFFVEGVAEELDAPGEWLYDAAAGRLLLWHNATPGTPPPQGVPGVPGTGVEVPVARVIVNVSGASGVSFSGVGFRDARATFMDPHGVPSGGDWALQRSGALYLEGTTNTTVDACAFSRVDGNALLAYGFQRGLAVTRSEFAWTGDSCVALWGETAGAAGVGVPTDGPDGTAGTQPVGSVIDSNWFHELGIYEKQAAAVFQAKAAGTAVTRNVAHNGPRAGILLNDGFGGGTTVRGNALFNLVRETGPPADHGPINFWDRQAYEWLDATGRRTSTKVPDAVERNLLFGDYWTQTPVDTDDGARFVSVADNALFGGTLGAKQPFAGACLAFARNLHARVGLGYHLFHAPDAGWAFVNSTLVQSADGNYGVGTVCAGPDATTLGGNAVATPTGNVTECGEPLAAWVAAGHDVGSHAELWPPDADVIAAAWALLEPVLG